MSGERGARYLGGGTLVMRAINEGDLSVSTLVRTDGPRAHAVRDVGPPHPDWRRRHLCGDPGRARACFPASGRALDWRPGDSQHGHGRRQSVCSGAVRRFRYGAAGARRDAACAGRIFAARGRASRSSSPRAKATRPLSCWRSRWRDHKRRSVPLSEGRADEAERRRGRDRRRACSAERRACQWRAHRLRRDGRDAVAGEKRGAGA